MAIGPQSAHINLEQSRKQAKELVKAFKAGDPKTLDTLRWNHPRFRKLSDAEIQKGQFVLADAQLVIARLHHFESWPKLLEHIETLTNANPEVSRFERAADAIVSGDITTLAALLRESPELIRQRSTRAHHAPLLHYVSANGVEDYRQVTPPNILEVTKLLLDAGAEVDAESNAYGGGSRALSLTATSAHPRAAGVQIALIDLLLEYGASLEEGDKHGKSLDERGGLWKLAHDALSNGCPEAQRRWSAAGHTLSRYSPLPALATWCASNRCMPAPAASSVSRRCLLRRNRDISQ